MIGVLPITGKPDLEKCSMAKKNPDRPIEIRDPNAGMIIPGYATANAAGTGTSVADQFKPRLRLKIVQGSSKSAAKDIGPEGSIVCVGNSQLVANAGESFTAYNIYQWVSYEKWADYKDQESQAVMERTLDPNSELGRRCRLRTSEEKTETYGQGGQFRCKYMEVLNSLFLVDSGPMAGELAVFSHNDRGGLRSRAAWSSLVSAAGRRGVPVYAMRFEFESEKFKLDNNEWWSLNGNWPRDGKSFAKEKDLPILKSAHDAAHEQYVKREITVEEEAGTVEKPSDSIPI